MFESPPLSDAEVVDAPDEAASYLAKLMPGADAVAGIALLDPASLSTAGRIDALVAIEKQLAWLHAVQQRMLASLSSDARPASRKPLDELAANWVREDVACALRLPCSSARATLLMAEELTGRLAATLRLLDRGEITMRHAQALADAVVSLDGETAAAVEARVLPKAPEQTVSAFRRSVKRAVMFCAPRSAEQRRQQGMADRRVSVKPSGDGMAEVWALVPAEGGEAVWAAVNALARECAPGDDRTADQRRADALVDIACSVLRDPNLPTQQGMRPAVHVTVALSTLLGCDEQPGELAGHGPIPASVARRIAADPTGTWRRLVTDPVTGKLLDYGRTTYRPPADLADFVIARDGTCTFVGCARNAYRCDLDHETPYPDGATNEENLAALCRRHHRAKHEAGWTVKRNPDTGVSTWKSPTGHTYRSEPPPLPTDRTTNPDDESRHRSNHHTDRPGSRSKRAPVSPPRPRRSTGESGARYRDDRRPKRPTR